MDWTDIEGRLQERIEDVCRHLFPQGRRDGAEYVVGNLAGEPGESLKINLAGKLGTWRDFAGDKGGKTLLSLWLQARGGIRFGQAVTEAKAYLGIEDGWQRVRTPGQGTGPTGVKDRPEDSSWRAVAEVWAQCQPPVEGGPVWQYLVEQRRLDPGVLALLGVREYLAHGKWAIVWPYFACGGEDEWAGGRMPPEPAGRMPALQQGAAGTGGRMPPEPAGRMPALQAPEWLKFELVERVNGKKREWTSKAPEKSLFGVQLARDKSWSKCRHVILCEGEKDAATWASLGCREWGMLPLSVPFGAKWKGQDKGRPSPNREWLDRAWDWLQDYETIFVALDGDEAGQRAAADIIAEVGPRRCRLVTLPYKDANECLMKGVAPAELRECLDGARDFAPDKIVHAADLEEQFLAWVFDRQADAGVHLPFEFPLRFRAGETTLWLGIEKSGKTTLLNFCTVAAMAQGERVLLASFEVPWPDSNDKLCRQALGDFYFDRKALGKLEGKLEREEFLAKARARTLETHRWLGQRLWYYVHVGIGNWRLLKDDIRWARRRLGITWIVVDNFMRLGIPKDDYAQQADAIIELVSLALELGVHLHIVLHQNKSEGAKGSAGGKRTASGAHELLGNPHNIVEVLRDDKKGKQVSELWEDKKVGAINDRDFAEKMNALELKPDGKFVLHAQRNGDTQDGSKYLWFLYRSQQYCDKPPGHTDHGPLFFVEEARKVEARATDARSAEQEIPF